MWPEAANPPADQQAAPGPASEPDSPQAAPPDLVVTASASSDVESEVLTASAARSAAPAVPTTRSRAEQLLQRYPGPSGDDGIDTFVEILRKNLDAGLDGTDPFAVDLGAAASYAARPDINPLGVSLTPEDTAELDAIIDDYQVRMRTLKHESYLEQMVALTRAVERGDFTRVPSGKWPDGLQQQLDAQTQARLGPDENHTNAPGADRGHRRYIALERATASDYWERADQLALQQAEFAVAVRTYFLQRRR